MSFFVIFWKKLKIRKTVAAQRLFCPLLHSEYKHTIPFTIEGYKRYTCNSIISIFAKTIIPISENHDTMFFEKVEIISSGIVLYRCNGKDVTNLKDHEIIALFFERSERAITELINKYGAAIKNVASNILKDAQDAEEAANDTYLTVWNRIPPTRPKYLGAYSCRIARNLSLKRFYANTAEKRNSYYDVALDELEETIPALSTVESTYDAKELTGYLNQFLNNLSKEDRYLFVRRYWYGDKIGDIAENLNVTPHRASVRLFRLRQKLQDYLKKEGMIA